MSMRNMEAERAILGGVFLDPANLTEIRTLVQPEDFAPEHQLMFRAMCRLHDAKELVDELTVTSALRESGALAQAGGPAAISMLVQTTPSGSNFRAYCRIVHNAGRVRRVSDTAMAVAFSCKDASIATDEDVRTFLADAQTKMVEATTVQSKGRNMTTGELLGRVFKFVQERVKSKGRLIGFPTGILGLDRLLLGWRRKRFHIIAARPGVGKTALAICTSTATAKSGARVYVVNREMGPEELGLRLVSAESRVEATRMEYGDIEDADYVRLDRAINDLQNLPIVWPEEPPATLAEIRSECQALKRNGGLDMLVVDYIQLITPEASKRNDTRDQQIGVISRGLKNLATELDIAVIGLSQLNRKTDEHEEPEVSHLRESGSLEADANVIVLMWAEKDNTNEVMAKLGKNRGGPLGKFKWRFERSIQKISEAPQS